MPSFRLSQTDKNNIVEYIRNELKRRQQAESRKTAEENWRRIDAQLNMEAPVVITENEAKRDRNAIQPGHLADSIEINTNDALRLLFPQDRKWFQPHLELPEDVEVIDQRQADGIYRSFMAQQHKDFSLKDRVKLMVNEAFAHGSFCGEVRWDRMTMFPDGRRVRNLSAPVIQPFSMWNSYPDPAPEVVGTDLFYRGSLIIESEIRTEIAQNHPLWRYKGNPRETRPTLSLVYFYGNVIVPRSTKNVVIPNRKVVIIDDELVYSEVNDLAYPSILFGGYERTDVRNPYYTSPIIKRGPSMSAATLSLNNFLDAADLKNFPPVVKDSMMTDEVDLSPGAENEAPAGQANLNVLDFANPEAALAAYQVLIDHVERGVGDERRSGVAPSTELTATGEMRLEQRAEVRISEFVNTFERQALLPFLYMQHELNRKHLESYPFFNDEINTADFLRISRKNIPANIIFEVTGSKTVLGEITRSQRFRETAAFVLSNEATLAQTDVGAVLSQAWQDSGVKDPERFVTDPETDQTQQAVQAAVQQVQAQAQQQIDALQTQLAQAQGQTEIQAARTQAEMQLKRQKQEADIELMKQDQARKDQEVRANIARADDEAQAKIDREDALVQEKITLMRLQSQQDTQRADLKARQESERSAREESRQTQLELDLQAKGQEPAQVININQARGGKKISIDRQADGRIVGATVQAIDEGED